MENKLWGGMSRWGEKANGGISYVMGEWANGEKAKVKNFDCGGE